MNITEWQLAAGRDRLREAAAAPVVGDAARLPIAAGTVDGIISVEAAFHFRSRRAFFDECYRVLRPGGVLSISDISVQRWPAGPAELLAGLTQLRVFGLRPSMAMTAGQIVDAARAALPGMFGILPSPMAAAAFLIDVNEWLTEYRVSLV